MRPESGLWMPANWQQIANATMTSQFVAWRHSQTSLALPFFCCQVSYCSKFHFNIMTVFGVMTIFLYKKLTKNPEIGNTRVWFLPNIWRLGQVRNTKFCTTVSNKKLLNVAKYHGNSFYIVLFIKGKPTRGDYLPPNGLTTLIYTHNHNIFFEKIQSKSYEFEHN